MNILQKYKLGGFLPFTFEISINPKTGKKVFLNFTTPFSTIEKYSDKHIDKRKAGYGIRMGMKHGDKYIIGFDVDNKIGQYNGLTKWTELLNKHYTIKDTDKIINIDESYNTEFHKLQHDKILLYLDTPIQKTGNNGYHYLFLVSEEQLKAIGGGILGLYVEDSSEKYSIDIKATNGYLACEPSKYKNKFYKWLKAPYDTNILDIPDWLFEIIKNSQSPSRPIKKIKTPSDKQEPAPIILNTKIDDNILKFLKCLSNERYNNYEEWIVLGHIMKFNHIPFEYFLKKSQQSNLYETDKYIIDKWASFKKTTYKLKSLYQMAKQDNLLEYNKITSNILSFENIDQLFNIENYTQLKINKEYLLNGDDKDIIINNCIDKWQTSDIKALNIKSKYGSGKTQLIKNIIKKYEPKRILYISYRQALTDNIEDEFYKFGFKSYLNGVFNADRQIIQLESVHKLYKKKIDLFEDDDNISMQTMGQIVPKYDLIILDEIESVLNHFHSKTFKNNGSEEAYNKLYKIITNSIKVISLDGDMNQRALKYVSNFGQMLTINNECNTSKRVFNFMSDEEIFKTELLKDVDIAIKDNKKIGICSMSKMETIKYESILLEHNKKIRILLINSDTAGEVKKKMKNIKKYILEYDIFIYSPSVEAGVNIDIKGLFNNLYCIVCGGSTSPHSFLQMTARIRHLNNNNINILNHSLNLNKCNNFYTYEEVKRILIRNNKLRVEHVTEIHNGEMYEKLALTPFCETYIYNKVEKLNNNSVYFMRLLVLYCEKKGIKTTFNDEQEKTKIKCDKEEYISKILDTSDIDDEELEILKGKENSRTAGTTELIQLNKNYYTKYLGVDKLNIDIMMRYYKKLPQIGNFISLINKDDIINTLAINEKHDKLLLIKKVINRLGFNDVFDKKEIHGDKFKIIIEAIRTENKEFFSHDARALFDMAKFKTDTTTDKAIIGHLNILLKNYSLNIKSKQKREQEKVNLSSFYHLEHLNNIDEILQYKILKDQIKCNIGILEIDQKNFIYKDLLNKKSLKKLEAFKPQDREIFDTIDNMASAYEDEEILSVIENIETNLIDT